MGGGTYCTGTQNIALSASGANTYSWSNGATTSSIVASPGSSQVFTVTGTYTTGCLTTSTVGITLVPCTNLTETTLNAQIQIKPNPSSGTLLISSHHPVSLKIVNQLGVIVQQLELLQNESLGIELTPGLYYMVENNNPRAVTKLIVLEH
jgi:hypothetical protein